MVFDSDAAFHVLRMQLNIQFSNYCSILTLLASLWLAAAQADELQFLLSEKVDLLSEQDNAMFSDMVELALDSQPDGYILSWGNPESGANGTLQIVSTDNDSEEYCRRIALVRHAKGFTEQSSMRFCRQADNTWTKKSP